MEFDKLYLTVEKLMKHKKLNKNQLSIKGDIPSSTITAFMKGKIKNPSSELIAKLAKALGMSYSDLTSDSVEIYLESLEKDIEKVKYYRRGRTYEEYAKYLESKTGVEVPPEYIKDVENGDVKSFKTLLHQIDLAEGLVQQEQMAVKGLDFMENELKEWISDPTNIEYLRFIYKAAKEGISKELLNKASISISFDKK